jgi:dipeptidyl aminopeptidase/acylaminoacyl peptidase
MRPLTLWQLPLALAGLLMTAGAATGQQAGVDLASLQTVAESSGYQATSNSQQVVDFVSACDSADHIQQFEFGRTVENRPMIAALAANPDYEIGDFDDSRLRILLLGNIHSGECAGKEALLALLRELAREPGHEWLADAVVVIAPNYNADANDRVGTDHRPGQVGPVAGMGLRENAQQLDLNRDFMKLESPEARALVGLMNRFEPHLFIDCHDTNGSEHQYALTYDIPHNPTTPQAIRDFLRNRMMPAVTESMRQDGLLSWYYGNFRGRDDRTVWETYGYEPRYSTEYAGLRGCLSVLSEAYAYDTYQERIQSSGSFVRKCVDFVRQNGDDVRSLLSSVRQQHIAVASGNPENVLVHLTAEMTAFPEKIPIEAYLDGQPHTFEVTFLGQYEPAITVSLPHAYALPPEMSLEAERLQMHGIQIEELVAPITIDATQYEITSFRQASQPFQKHRMATLEAEPVRAPRELAAGTYIVRTAQPLGRVAACLLEPESCDGLATWNFVDSHIASGGPFPFLRIEEPVDAAATRPLTVIEPRGRLAVGDIFGENRHLFPNPALDELKWLPDSAAWVQDKNGRPVRVEAATGAESAPPLPADRRAVADAFRGIDGISAADVQQILRGDLQWRGDSAEMMVLEKDERRFVLLLGKLEVRELGTSDAPAELVDLNPDGTAVAWVQANNLMVWNGTGEPVAITSDGSDKILNGKLDWVYQEELYGRGNFKGFWWSPDGKYISWLRSDETPVHTYTVVDHLPVLGRLEVSPYPKAGDPLPIVTLHSAGIEDLQETKTEFPLPSEGREPLRELLISWVTWDKTSNTMLVQVQDRIQSWLDLYRFDPRTGEAALLFRDQTGTWIESPGDPVILDDGSFFWLSPRSGFRSIYHMAPDGHEIRRLPTGDWEVRELIGCDNESRVVRFYGSPDSPLAVVPMEMDIGGDEPRKLVDWPGTQTVSFSEDGAWFLCRTSTATEPPSIHLFSAEGKWVRTVVPSRDDRLRHLDVPQPEVVCINCEEAGTPFELDAMLIKPPDFDESRQYPVVVHIYAGPQAPRVRDGFNGKNWLWHQYLAQQGFVVFIVDNRSASYRSARQAWPIYRNLASQELADLEQAVAWLKTHPWIDGERIGLWGWSYGGYMTAFALTHSTTFAAGVAGAPVTDWRNYDAIYTERLMDTPQANPEGYAASGVLAAAENLHGRLMLIHGTIDDNVHMSNTLQLVHALQQAGKQFELMLYPDNRHALRNDAQEQHMYEMIAGFFKRHLMEGAAGN